MGRSKLDKQYVSEQKQAEAATKKPEKAGKKKNAKAEEEPAQTVEMPENLEDYKGARKQLRQAVKAVVKANTAKIAEKIVEKAKDGDMRDMLSLIEKKKAGKAGKKKKRDGPSWAELLASEPEWDGEDGEAAGQQVSEPAG